MSSVFIIVFGLIGFTFGWFVYSKFIAEKREKEEQKWAEMLK